jgi:hypothetical protein
MTEYTKKRIFETIPPRVWEQIELMGAEADFLNNEVYFTPRTTDGLLLIQNALGENGGCAAVLFHLVGLGGKVSGQTQELESGIVRLSMNADGVGILKEALADAKVANPLALEEGRVADNASVLLPRERTALSMAIEEAMGVGGMDSGTEDEMLDALEYAAIQVANRRNADNIEPEHQTFVDNLYPQTELTSLVENMVMLAINSVGTFSEENEHKLAAEISATVEDIFTSRGQQRGKP